MALKVIRGMGMVINAMRHNILSQPMSSQGRAFLSLSRYCSAPFANLSKLPNENSLYRKDCGVALLNRPNEMGGIKSTLVGARHLATHRPINNPKILSQASDKDIHLLAQVEKHKANDPHEICEQLLQGGANPNFRGHQGRTALHIATNSNSLELVKLLLEYGANPNMPDEFGLTSLHVAVMNRSLALIPLLMEYGADPYIPVGDFTALELTEDPVIIELIVMGLINRQ